MSTAPPAVRIRPIVPHVDGERVLADGTDLPAVDVVPDPTTLVAAPARFAELGLSGPVVESIIDFTDDDDLDGPRQAIMQLPAHHDDAATGGLRWIGRADLVPRVAGPLAPIVAEMLAELGGEADPHPRRVAWATVGWYERAAEWIRGSLRGAGRAEPDSIVQFRHWGISAVMRVDAPDGRTWFKASYPPFAHEGPVTAHLDVTVARGTPSVVAVEPDEAWMLTDDIGQTETSDRVDQAAAVELLVSIQAHQADMTGALVALGCPDRAPGRFAADLAAALESEVAQGLGLTAAARAELVTAVEAATERLQAAGLPATLVHGDFHPGNTAATPDGPVIFDWTDACVSTPVVDLATWAWWYSDEPDRQAEIWGWFTEAWARHFGVHPASLDRTTVDIVAGAFHTVSYLRLIDGLEPRRRFESAGGPEHFVRLIEQAMTAQSGT